jgi:hypothetical protein
MRLNTDQKLKPLRRTVTPYTGQIVIFSVITIFLLFVAYRSSQWAFAWSTIVIWAGFAVMVYFGLRYGVLWDGTGIVMRASGLPERRIRYDEIREVKIEMAQLHDLLAQSRPFRRIVVHGYRGDPNAFVDVSLRHFRPGDIDELLAAIRTHRPDLTVPTVPWGTGSL